jgi:DNA-binding beta-propeller fold protein YncE
MPPSFCRPRTLLRFLAFLSGLAPVFSSVSRADELLVSGFTSDAVARFDAASGSHVGNITAGGVNGPQAVRLGPDGFLYLANEENDNILRFDATTKAFLAEFVSSGDGGLDGPTALDFGPDGHLYVASFNTDSVLKYDGQTGDYIDDFVASGAGGLNGPDVGMLWGPDGNLYVPSFFNNRVIRYDGSTAAATTIVSPLSPGGLTEPRTILFHTDGLMYVACDSGDKVNRYQMNGTFVSTYVAAGAGGLDGASGMAFDADGVLYVSSWRNNRVLRYDTNGAAIGDFFPANSGGINGPTFLMFLADPIIPAASTWGLLVFALFVLSAGTITLARRSARLDPCP